MRTNVGPMRAGRQRAEAGFSKSAHTTMLVLRIVRQQAHKSACSLWEPGKGWCRCPGAGRRWMVSRMRESRERTGRHLRAW